VEKDHENGKRKEIRIKLVQFIWYVNLSKVLVRNFSRSFNARKCCLKNPLLYFTDLLKMLNLRQDN